MCVHQKVCLMWSGKRWESMLVSDKKLGHFVHAKNPTYSNNLANHQGPVLPMRCFTLASSLSLEYFLQRKKCHCSLQLWLQIEFKIENKMAQGKKFSKAKFSWNFYFCCTERLRVKRGGFVRHLDGVLWKTQMKWERRSFSRGKILMVFGFLATDSKLGPNHIKIFSA